MGLMMKVRREEIVPFVIMVLMEGCTIALTIMAKTAITGGMSPFVFIAYTNSLGSLLLIPFSFLFHKQPATTEHSLFTWPLLMRIFFLGFTGVFMFQNLAFVGLSFSSPIVVCAMGLLLPAFSFLLSLLLGKRSLEWGSRSTRVKVMGTLISISGGVVEEFYKGPYIRPSSSPPKGLLGAIHSLFVYYRFPDNWALGGLFLAAAAFSVTLFNIIQVGTVQKYPNVMKIVASYSVVGTIQCIVFSLVMERDFSAWELKPNMDLLLIILTGIFGSVIRTSVHVKCTQMKGPFYVPLFKPFGILWATIFGTSFFVNSLCYGSVLGAAIAGVGYYAVTWGNIKEDECKRKEKTNEQKVPLLKDDDDSHV